MPESVRQLHGQNMIGDPVGGPASHYNTASTEDKKPQEELDPCVRYVRDCFDDWKAHWGAKFTKFESYYDSWRGMPPKRDKDWQAQFHKKLSWQAEKALVAQYHAALFPTSAPIDYDATEVQDELQGIMGKSIVGHWFKVGNVSLEWLRASRSAAIYGTGLFEDDWFMRVEKIKEIVPTPIPDFRPMVGPDGQPILDEFGNVRSQQIGMRIVPMEQETMQVLEDRYRVRKANVFSWLPHPDKVSDDDDYPMIKQEFVTFEDLLKRQVQSQKYGFAPYQNIDKLQKDMYKPNDEDLRRFKKEGDFVDKKNPPIELLHFWGGYADKPEGNYDTDPEAHRAVEKKPMWIMVANRKYKLQQVDNPFWHKKPPAFHIVWTEDDKPSYYGIGLVEIGQSAEDRANRLVNVRTDERSKNIKGGGWYNALDKKIKKSQLHNSTPGLWKACSDPKNSVMPDPIVPSTPDDYKEEEVAVNDHREITGATTSLLPTADEKQAHETLGGLQLMLGQANQRLKPDMSAMEQMGIRRIANRAFMMTRQFFTKPQAIELMATNEELRRFSLDRIYTFTPQDVIGNVNFICTGLAETIEKAKKIDTLIKYAELTSKIPPMQMITNYQGIAKRIALWLGFENIEDLVIGLNPMDPLAPFMPPMMPGMLPPGVPPPGSPPAGPPRPGQGAPQPRPQQGQPPQGAPPGMPPPGGNGKQSRIPPEILAQLLNR